MLAAEKEDKKMEREKARAESAQREADLAMKTLKEKQNESKIRVAKRRSKISKFTMKGKGGARGAKFVSEMGEFEKQDDDSDDEGGASTAVTSTDANEEEVDDIGNGSGDYYGDSAVKADMG